VLDLRPAGPAQVPPLPLAPGHDLLVACPYFALERLRSGDYTLAPQPTSFEIHTLIAGRADIAGETLAPGESLLLPADRDACTVHLSADGVLLRCYVPDLANDLWPRLQALGYEATRMAQTVRTSFQREHTR
jgi:mannose-6-phosphate isomerase